MFSDGIGNFIKVKVKKSISNINPLMLEWKLA